ncbi:DEAD/DEAH box helicase [Puniceicoccus vermicola]|uniref:DEAD/DEAH box helicase n=1 Tax=Puniceicoccus vermicola TaxID=388746 RepID=A0A7X1AYI5_9BACT|nr:DEAD/DEAH box helicase [Puniceicoccus vermicola]MBC2602350.1 DEAD/DEAH box helicase [Puniceicoccus vermicola]
MSGSIQGRQFEFPASASRVSSEDHLLIPDIWQQDAIRFLQSGSDVVVDAPTGAGKTFVFEQLVQKGAIRKAVYTVPTRALANDKLMEWRTRGWNVGIATGDLADNLAAPVVVATLETQRHALLRGEGPELLVIDEYQMLNDPLRGLHYELAIASAPPETQLLLLSGSTSNPGLIADWLRRLGRKVELVQCAERPVPQEEVNLDALRQKVPQGVRGYWPRRIAKALAAGLGPILIFAPQRQVAEEIAKRLAVTLPPCEPLELTSEQNSLVRGPFRKLLSRRIAYHHSGLDYALRAGIIEPLAKLGQLRVIVATTGLAAGINFSMRSVLVTETHYRFGEEVRRIRSDELLQMFGRAGRRGIDPVGYILTGADKPRLRDGRSVDLAPNRRIDWQACLTTLQASSAMGIDPRRELEDLNRRFLSAGKLNLGLREELPLRFGHPKEQLTSGGATRRVEMKNLDGEWERLGKKRQIALGEAYFFNGRKWIPAISSPEVLKAVRFGTLCRIPQSQPLKYGRMMVVALFPREEGHRNLDLTKSFRKLLQKDWAEHQDYPKPASHCPLDVLESTYLPRMARMTSGGVPIRWEEHRDEVRVYLDYSEAVAFCRIDSSQRALINPPMEEKLVDDQPDMKMALGGKMDDKPRRPARNWLDLGLIDSRFRPTRRGVIFSFFSQGEGLAIAAGLEDPSFEISELIFQLANLRAGHRFEELPHANGRLGDLSRLLYGWRTIPGYLKRGVPTEYGEGAAEVVAAIVLDHRKAHEFETDQVRAGDMQRAVLEWRAILRQIVHSPDFAWDRWIELRDEAWRHLQKTPPSTNLDSLPPIPIHQMRRLEFR